MEGESILQTTAEVSVALAGFTGVVAAFGQRRGHWTNLDTLRFQMMLTSSLAALVFSLLPLAVHYIGAKPAATWAISSGLLASYYLIWPSIDVHRWRRSGTRFTPHFRLWVMLLLVFLAAVALVTQVLNALNIGLHRAFGPYLLGVCLLILICAIIFARLLSFVGQQFAEE